MANIWQTLAEACQTLGISQRTLYRRIDKGKVESKTENNRRLVLVSLPDDKPVADNMADSGRLAILQARNEALEQDIEKRNRQIAELESDNLSLRSQLIERDRQVTELHQVVAVAQNQAQQLIERLQTPFWRRWFSRKALPAPEVVMDMESTDKES